MFGMAERRSGSRLLLESLQPARVPRELRRQDLDRHLARRASSPAPGTPPPCRPRPEGRGSRRARAARRRQGSSLSLAPASNASSPSASRPATSAWPGRSSSRPVGQRNGAADLLAAKYVPFLLPRSSIVAPSATDRDPRMAARDGLVVDPDDRLAFPSDEIFAGLRARSRAGPRPGDRRARTPDGLVRRPRVRAARRPGTRTRSAETSE